MLSQVVWCQTLQTIVQQHAHLAGSDAGSSMATAIPIWNLTRWNLGSWFSGKSFKLLSLDVRF